MFENEIPQSRSEENDSSRAMTIQEEELVAKKVGNEKSFLKKQSIHVLAMADSTRSTSSAKRHSDARKNNLFSKFRDSTMGLDRAMPSLNTLFKINVFSNTQLNSVYRKATMMNSFNRGDSLFAAFQGGVETQKSGRD